MRVGKQLAVNRGPWLGAVCLSVAIFLPFLVQMFHGPLPYVHYSGVKVRFFVSLLLGLAICIHALSLMEKPAIFREGALKGDPFGDPLGSLKRGIMIVVGCLLFMWGGALWSHNLFGFVSHLLPAKPYLETVAVEGTWMDGSRRRKDIWQKLSMRAEDGEARYLVIDHKLTDGYWYQAGETLRLAGWKTILGPYVTRIERVQSESKGEEN